MILQLLFMHLAFGFAVGLLAISKPQFRRMSRILKNDPEYAAASKLMDWKIVLITMTILGFFALLIQLIEAFRVINRRHDHWEIFTNLDADPAFETYSLQEAEAIAKVLQEAYGKDDIYYAVDPGKRRVRIYKWSEME